MTLINCSECGSKVPDDAERCSGCGKSIKKPVNRQMLVIIIAGMIFLMGIGAFLIMQQCS